MFVESGIRLECKLHFLSISIVLSVEEAAEGVVEPGMDEFGYS